MAAAPGGVEVSRISVRAVPDTSRLYEELRADLAEIERRVMIDVRASVDSAELVASAKEAVAEAQALAGDLDIKANIDHSQLDELGSSIKGATGGIGGLLSGFSLLGTGAGVLSTALIPLTAVVGGLVAALAAPLATVAGGVTIFGFIAGLKIKDVLAQQKAIQTLDTKLSTLSKGTTEYAQVQNQLAVAQDNLKKSGGAPFVAALDAVKGALAALPTKAILLPITDGLNVLAAALPKLRPIVSTVSHVLDGLVTSFGNLVKSPGFKGFVQSFAKDLGRDLKAFATIAGNIFVGLGGLFGALDKQLSGGVLKGLEGISKKFADFGRSAESNPGLKAFVKYVKDNMPTVGRLVGGLFDIIGKALEALAPVGTVALDAITGIVGAFQDLGRLAGPLAGTRAVFGAGSFFGGPEVGAAAAAVVALVGGFEHLYQHSKPLQKILKDIGDYFVKTWLPKIQDAAHDVLPALQSAFSDISDTIRNNKGLFETIGKAFAAVASVVVIGGLEQLANGIRGLGKAFKVSVEAVKLFANVSIAEFRLVLGAVKVLVDLVLAQFGTIVDASAAAFGWLPHIGGQITDAKNKFHAFADGISNNIDSASQTLDNLQKQINAVGQSHPKFRVDSNTLDQIRYMHELQNLQIQDKHFKITAAIETSLERVTGPGGGMGRPGDIGSSSGGGAGTGSGSSKPGINIQNMYTRDLSDIERQSNNLSRQRSGGGVSLVGGGL